MWADVVTEIIATIAITLSSKFYRISKDVFGKKFTVSEIVEGLNNGEISLGDNISVQGTFSEFVPFVDFATLINDKISGESVGTCRLGDLVSNGNYIGALFPEGTTTSKKASIPLIYSVCDKSKKLFSYSTGDQLRLECMIIPLDYDYRRILNKTNYFCYDGKPFGLRVLNVKKIEEKVDAFEIDAFILSSLQIEKPYDDFFQQLVK